MWLGRRCDRALRYLRQVFDNLFLLHDDCVLSEFIKALDDNALEVLAALFKVKLLNPGGAEEEWQFHSVRLLEKLANTIRIDKFRPIAILPTLYKLYSICLGLLAGPAFDNLKAPQFAFRKGYQVVEVTFIF